MIVDPWGEILAVQAEGEGVVLAEMDAARIQEVQAALPAHANRRMH
jgi:nitrilase